MTMQIEETLIFRLEQLAKLELDAEERAGLMSDLNHILTLVEQMNQLDHVNLVNDSRQLALKVCIMAACKKQDPPLPGIGWNTPSGVSDLADILDKVM